MKYVGSLYSLAFKFKGNDFTNLISGKAQMNDGYHFLKLVSYLRSIKQHQNIVECLGFATESGKRFDYYPVNDCNIITFHTKLTTL